MINIDKRDKRNLRNIWREIIEEIIRKRKKRIIIISTITALFPMEKKFVIKLQIYPTLTGKHKGFQGCYGEIDNNHSFML